MVSAKPEVVALKGIVINGGKIDKIIPSDAKEALPAGAQTIDAGQSFILPGLIDAHVHFRTWFPEIFLEYGVTTLMDTGPCGADCEEDPNEFILRWRRDLNGTKVRGPSLYTTGMKLSGPKGEPEKHTYFVNSAAELSQKIEFLAGLRWMPSRRKRACLRLAQAARRRGTQARHSRGGSLPGRARIDRGRDDVHRAHLPDRHVLVGRESRRAHPWQRVP